MVIQPVPQQIPWNVPKAPEPTPKFEEVTE